jgi:hypothetical protein
MTGIKFVFIVIDAHSRFMFPIEDGSQSNYNVLEDDVAELKADPEWLANYHESVMWVAKAWGWDVKEENMIQPKESGMGWDNWDVRLAKIIRSLWLFGENQLMTSMQKFARIVAPNGGLRYGGIILDEVFYMTLDDPIPPPDATPESQETQSADESQTQETQPDTQPEDVEMKTQPETTDAEMKTQPEAADEGTKTQPEAAEVEMKTQPEAAEQESAVGEETEEKMTGEAKY